MTTLRYIAEPGCEPLYASDGAGGIDLRANRHATVHGGATEEVSTGLRVEIQPGYVGLVRGRSGLAFRHDVWAFEGTIDSDYRGTVMVKLVNRRGSPFELRRGDRIAQLVIVPVARCVLAPVAELSATARGEGGFGSSGR